MSFNSNIDFSNSSNIYGNSLSLLLQAFAREGQKAKQCSIFFYDEVSAKGSFQKHFSGFCPLRGGGHYGLTGRPMKNENNRPSNENKK